MSRGDSASHPYETGVYSDSSADLNAGTSSEIDSSNPNVPATM